MENKVTKTDKISAFICMGILIIACFSIILMMFTRVIIVRKLGISNAFTLFLLAGNDELNKEGHIRKDIAWQDLYKFDHPDEESTTGTNSKKPDLIDEYKAVADSVKENINPYVTSYFIGYNKEVELAKKYDEAIGWSFVSFGEYNGVSQMPDGYLVEYVEERSADEWSGSMTAFRDFVQSNGAGFLYVQLPYKVSEYEDTDISGYMDFSNQNADRLIEQLKKADVNVYDLRECIRDEGLDNHSLFYRTDGHWKTTTGLWGAKRILEYCNEKHGLSAETQRLDIEAFDQKVYEKWFLGAQGTKVTLSRAEPEDFILLYPKYDTRFHYVVPAMGIDEEGGYGIVYDMEQVEKKDYYNKNPYAACNYGDQPVQQIENLNTADDKKILIIHDSFGDCLIPAIALCEKEVHALDLRHFTGSVEEYIRQNKPDLVIVMYNAGIVCGEIDRGSHRSIADFR